MKRELFGTAGVSTVLRPALMVLAFGLVLAGCPVESEEGETRKNAIQLTEDTWADGAISSTSEEQWFKFTATAGTQYLHIFFGTLTDLYVQLYDSNNNALGDRTELYSSTRYKSLTVTSGREYYIKVTPYGSNGGTYRIGFNTMPLPCGTLAAATMLTANTWADGVIAAASGEQWFKFTATTGMHYLHAFFGTLTDLNVRLYDSNGGTLGNNINLYTSTKYTSLVVTSGQVYYVRVTPYNNGGGGTYKIAFNTSTTAPTT
ncbi:MAG: pre-peptidase C-terminal domain-containing protein [Treponema sp.]|jgi:hypothetical protein|nr:pre-peptidase C-terminal domain-containing protein [Treponema sp.]